MAFPSSLPSRTCCLCSKLDSPLPYCLRIVVRHDPIDLRMTSRSLHCYGIIDLYVFVAADICRVTRIGNQRMLSPSGMLCADEVLLACYWTLDYSVYEVVVLYMTILLFVE